MFGQLGDMAGLMKKAAEMQSALKKTQEALAAMEITGESSNGIVKITISGNMEKVTGVSILPAALAPANAPALERATAEAFENALAKVREESAKQLGPLAGGLGLPGLGK